LKRSLKVRERNMGGVSYVTFNGRPAEARTLKAEKSKIFNWGRGKAAEAFTLLVALLWRSGCKKRRSISDMSNR